MVVDVERMLGVNSSEGVCVCTDVASSSGSAERGYGSGVRPPSRFRCCLRRCRNDMADSQNSACMEERSKVGGENQVVDVVGNIKGVWDALELRGSEKRWVELRADGQRTRTEDCSHLSASSAPDASHRLGRRTCAEEDLDPPSPGHHGDDERLGRRSSAVWLLRSF